jgi:hypothetical protein
MMPKNNLRSITLKRSLPSRSVATIMLWYTNRAWQVEQAGEPGDEK